MRRPALLLDTNVWLDFELPGENFDEIRHFLRTARDHDARLGIAVHSLKDVAVLVERRIKQASQGRPHSDAGQVGAAARATSWAVVNHILEQAEVVGSDYMDAYMAEKDRVFHDFFEDNLVVSAVRRMEADLLVTSDASLLKHAPVPALPPAKAADWLTLRARS